MNTIFKNPKKRNTLVGLGILAGVLGIYAYTMYAVKQKKFLDKEFDKPGASLFFLSNLDIPLFRSRIISEINGLTNASHVVSFFVHAQYCSSCDLLLKKNGGQPQATCYFLKNKNILLRLGWPEIRSEPSIKQ